MNENQEANNLNPDNLKQNPDLNQNPKQPEKSGPKKRGTKEEVFNGSALQTGGGLRKADLILNKRNQIVSKKRSEQGAKQFKNIEKYIKNKKKCDEPIAAEEQAHQEINLQIQPEENNNNQPASNQNQKACGLALKADAFQEEKIQIIDNIPASSQSVNNKPAVVNQSASSKPEEVALGSIPELKPQVKVKRGRARKIKDMPPVIEEVKIGGTF